MIMIIISFSHVIYKELFFKLKFERKFDSPSLFDHK